MEEATEYLIQYISSPNSELSEKAKSLKAELESASSSDKAAEALRQMTADELSNFEALETLPSFVKFSRDGLSAVFGVTLRSALPQEKVRRAALHEQIIAEEKKLDDAHAEALLTSKMREGHDFVLEITEIAIVPSPFWKNKWLQDNVQLKSAGIKPRTWEQFCENLGGVTAMNRLEITVSFTNRSERRILDFLPQQYFISGGEKSLISRIGLSDEVDNHIKTNSIDEQEIPYGVDVNPKETVTHSLYFDVPQKAAKFVLLTIPEDVISFNSTALSEEDFVFRLAPTEYSKPNKVN